MKILIVNNNMHIGGIQKALVNMLAEIADKHDVTLFLFNPAGELMKDIPGTVRILCANAFTGIMGMSSSEAKEKGIITFAYRSFWTALTRIFGIKFTYGVLGRMESLCEEYDVAISYMQNSSRNVFYGGCNEIVLNSAKAKKKLAFVHCDFKNYTGNNGYNRSLYGRFDKIVCVSDSTRTAFLEVCPEYSEKTVAVHNFYNFGIMKKRAEEYIACYDKGSFNIFVSARLSPEKGVLRAIKAVSGLRSEGFNVKLYVAGDGAQRQEAEALSAKLGAETVFLGMLENPYPYFKDADLLLVPSYNEAAPMVYAEAMCFGTPILTTDTTSARELVENFGGGKVCGNTDRDIEDALRRIITDNASEIKKDIDVGRLNALAAKEFEDCLVYSPIDSGAERA